MIRNKTKWWLPKEFMQQNLGPYFVGYEASARLSELTKMYPDVFLAEKEGRFIKRKIDIEALKKRITSGLIDPDLRKVALQEIETSEFF